MLARPADRLRLVPGSSLLAIALVLTSHGATAAADPALRCEHAAARALRLCVRAVNRATAACHREQGIPCAADDAGVAGALDRLRGRVLGGCPDAPTVQAVGYGPLLTPAALVSRLREACAGEAASLAARAFGGPRAAARAAADPAEQQCLEGAHDDATRFVTAALRLHTPCVLRMRRGASCDAARVAARLAALTARVQQSIGERCTALGDLVAIDVAEFVARTAAQARCLLAVAHGGNPTPFDLDCGPRPAVSVPPPGTPVRIVLDEAQWGTRCGDGSPYAFWIRLAPAGEPVENVVVHLQGGGVCIFADECAAVSPGLLRATDNTFDTGGYMSNDPDTNPFGTWTKVYLPYCTQDVFAGGGVTNVFPAVTVHRFGAVNTRAALRYVRDVLWGALDQQTVEGYRPDRLRVVFGGTSAGGFGVEYNYHYVLDDLRWAHTTAVPSAALGLDNGEFVGLRGLGLIITSAAWGGRPYLPPYCFGAECAIVPVLQARTSPRLQAIAAQQILNVSNQVDSTQRATTYFSSTVAWINALRSAYCANQGLPGIRYFMPAIPTSIHSIIATTPQFQGMTSDGVLLKDWLASALSAPDAVADRVEEGTLTSAFPGVAPFPCPVE